MSAIARTTSLKSPRNHYSGFLCDVIVTTRDIAKEMWRRKIGEKEACLRARFLLLFLPIMTQNWVLLNENVPEVIEGKLIPYDENLEPIAIEEEAAALCNFYGSWHLYICCPVFGHSTFFVASLVFIKGTSCCFIRRNFKWNWAFRSRYGKVL